jgi:hypothetical protein
VTLISAAYGILMALIGGVLGAFIRSRPALRKIDAEREANLLSERAEEMAAMRLRIDRLENLLAQKDIEHEAERRADRHKINNLSQCLDALLLLIEQDPAKAAEAAAKVRKMRDEQQTREVAESATLRAAKISGWSE